MENASTVNSNIEILSPQTQSSYNSPGLTLPPVVDLVSAQSAINQSVFANKTVTVAPTRSPMSEATSSGTTGTINIHASPTLVPSRRMSKESKDSEDHWDEHASLVDSSIHDDDPLHQDTGSARPSCTERLYGVTVQAKNSPTCLVIYVTLLLLNIFVVIWDVTGGHANHWVAITIELIVNFMLILEVSITLAYLGCDYFKEWSYILDLMLTLACVSFFFIFVAYAADSRSPTSKATLVDGLLLVLRYSIQFCRIIWFMWRSRKTTHALQVDDIPPLPQTQPLDSGSNPDKANRHTTDYH